ncbi:peptidylprolyl isomerase [Desulforhopalus vacuolatus]|uniref:peptidylprolyl isomerase n=1 Tax=Desulforhopalus vacuolatus TaxID=40414 RepID=UPI001964960E|nr:peptidylprolyl isomerase [Desulforhopalus vacuolatus]MBM9519926.1 peptidylprolyl isomerase [Desulforhopalus vacuolatus]
MTVYFTLLRRLFLRRTFPFCTALLVFALFVSVLFPAGAAARLLDKVVAVVDNDVITLSELNAEIAQRYKSLLTSSDPADLAQLEDVRRKTLESIIDRRLLSRKAKEANITVSDLEIDRAFKSQRERSGLSQAQFLSQIKQAGVSEAVVRDNIQAGILQSKLLNVDVRSKIVITDTMVKNYYQKNYIETIDGKTYQLLQMGFAWGEKKTSDHQRSKKKALEMAKEIRTSVLAGKDFKKLAKKYSDLPSASDGGDIGSFSLDEMAPSMAGAIKGLRASQVSDIIETSDGYQFFQVTGTDKNAVVITAEYEDVKNEIREKLFQKQLQAEYEDWIKKLKADAYIQKM